MQSCQLSMEVQIIACLYVKKNVALVFVMCAKEHEKSLLWITGGHAAGIMCGELWPNAGRVQLACTSG